MDEMDGLLTDDLIMYAVDAWVSGYRAEDRTMIGMVLGVSDDDLDTICKMLAKWEKKTDKSN